MELRIRRIAETSTTRKDNLKNTVVKSNGEFEAWQEDERRQRKNEIGRLELVKGDWINLLEDYSAKKRKVPVDTATTRNMIRAAHKSEACNSHEVDSSRTTFRSTRGSREISNLESIIRNFEKGYLSPSKKERATDEYKQKNFVKKIVEAFEVKYNIYNDSKTAQEISESLEVNKSNAAPMLESWKRKSKILCDSFKNGSSRSNPNSGDVDECDGGALSSEERIFRTSRDNNRLIGRRLRMLENSKRLSESEMILSAFGRKSSGLEICSTFLQSSSDSSSPSNCFTRAELMRKIELSDSAKRLSPDKTKTTNRVDIYMTSSEETIFTANDSLPTTSTLIDESLQSEHNSTPPEISHADKSPKIVGAFLKKPINVENTFIDWVPVIGKRLPRKRSLKKLLCSLTSGKLIKRFSSERNLSEEPRELQDSDDERSCSSMSLTSLISIADALRHQENIYFESNGRSDLKTFKSKNKSNEELNETLNETYFSAESQKGKQLLLTEVPREDVNLDLGPSYPPPSQTTRLLSPLVGQQLVSKLSNHPCVSKIPKNPFVTSIKIDNLAKFNSCQVYRNGNVSSSVIIKNDLYEVELRRSCSDLPSSNVYGSSSSVTSHYDVPRRFLSESENEILWMWKSKSKLNRNEEPIYDIPKSRSIERPRSNIYDNLESHHAITRPIDTRIYMNTQVQLSSSNNLISDI